MSNEYLEPIDDIIQAFAEVHENVSADACKVISTNDKERGSFLQICVGGQPDAKEMVFRMICDDPLDPLRERPVETYSQYKVFSPESVMVSGRTRRLENNAINQINMNLVGIMNAKIIYLGFTSAQGFNAWKKSTEFDYLRYIKPWLKDKMICVCTKKELVGSRILRDPFFSDLNTCTYYDIVKWMGSWVESSDEIPYLINANIQQFLEEKGLFDRFAPAQIPSFVDAMTPVPYVNENGELKDLLIGQTEITQALYESVMGVNPSIFTESGELPVEQVSWFDLLEFCNRLSAMQGFRPCYTIDGEDVEWDRSADGYRLPTDHEWEYIARANRGFDYSGSDDVDAVAWYHANSDQSTHDVGTKKENSFGSYDQSGNVWEWCWDLYDPRLVSRVLRGGAWAYGASNVHAAIRTYYLPSFQFRLNGGRLVRSPDLP